MEAEQTIGEIEWLERIFAAPDTRPLSASDLSAVNRRHDKSVEEQLKTFIAKFEAKNQAFIRAVRRALKKRLPTANELCVSLPCLQLDTTLMPKRGFALHHYLRQAFPIVTTEPSLASS
jgi:hypothetical protein